MSNIQPVSGKFASIKIALVFIGTIMGAGFASGREIVSFFGEHSGVAIILIPFVSILFFFCCYGFLVVGSRMKGVCITESNKIVFGKLSTLMDIFVLVSHVIVLSSMIAGINSISHSLLPNASLPWISIGVWLIAYFVTLLGLRGIVNVNIVLLPLIVCFMLFVTIFNIADNKTTVALSYETDFLKFFSLLWSCVLYMGMNMLTASPVVSPAGSNLLPKQRFHASLYGSLFVGICMLFIMLAIFTSGNSTMEQDMPIFALSQNVSNWFSIICSVIILSGILTTLLTSTFALTTFFQPIIKKKYITTFFVMMLGTIVSLIGFTNIVDWLYPVMGVMGIVYILAIFIFCIKTKKTIKTQDIDTTRDT